MYFDLDKELMLQVDSGRVGLGATLMQDGKPIEYASSSLALTERRCTQIEKELLSIVFGSRTIRSVNGRKMTIETDHKPLATIL